MAGILFLGSLEQVTLFKHELSGQISDGHWENSAPRDHWKFWCNADLKVTPEGTEPGYVTVNWDTPCRTYYGTTSPALLSVVGERMMRYVRLVKALGAVDADEVIDVLSLDGELIVPEWEGEYWEAKRVKVNELSVRHGWDKLQAILTDEKSYNRKSLRADLKAISKAMRKNLGNRDRVSATA